MQTCMSDFQWFLNNRHFVNAPPGVPLYKGEKGVGSAEDISAYDNTFWHMTDSRCWRIYCSVAAHTEQFNDSDRLHTLHSLQVFRRALGERIRTWRSGRCYRQVFRLMCSHAFTLAGWWLMILQSISSSGAVVSLQLYPQSRNIIITHTTS